MIDAETIIATVTKGRSTQQIISMVCKGTGISPEEFLNTLISPSSSSLTSPKAKRYGVSRVPVELQQKDDENRNLLWKAGLFSAWDGPGSDEEKMDQAIKVSISLGFNKRGAIYACPWDRPRIAKAANLSRNAVDNHIGNARKDCAS